jgi:enoyl-CoA hydratase/carnithine racemase
METTTARPQDELQVRTEDGVVSLVLNRPETRNALSRALLARLEKVLTAIEVDPKARVVVLGSTGPVFCAGHDLSEMTGRSKPEYRDLFAACSRVMLQLRRIPQPVIARVQGMATAAGCQLVAACDLAVASTEAQFATPGVRIGLFCTTPMVPLVRAIPDKAAMEMLLTGAPISAERALALGLVNRVVPTEELDLAIRQWTDAISATSPLAIRLGKRAFYELRDLDEPAAYARAVEVMTDNAVRHDAQEGMTAFLQKRKPVWTGE